MKFECQNLANKQILITSYVLKYHPEAHRSHLGLTATSPFVRNEKMKHTDLQMSTTGGKKCISVLHEAGFFRVFSLPSCNFFFFFPHENIPTVKFTAVCMNV